MEVGRKRRVILDWQTPKRKLTRLDVVPHLCRHRTLQGSGLRFHILVVKDVYVWCSAEFPSRSRVHVQCTFLAALPPEAVLLWSRCHCPAFLAILAL